MGCAILHVPGDPADFLPECGGHRYQQNSGGRVHSSTVTVAVLPEPEEAELKIDDRDLVYTTCCASGAGGQHVNRTESAVQLRHIPTGIMVRCETERSQYRNKQTALATLRARLWELRQNEAHNSTASMRKGQVGSGARSDKSWTVRYQDSIVTQHATGRKIRLKDYLAGNY